MLARVTVDTEHARSQSCNPRASREPGARTSQKCPGPALSFAPKTGQGGGQRGVVSAEKSQALGSTVPDVRPISGL